MDLFCNHAIVQFFVGLEYKTTHINYIEFSFVHSVCQVQNFTSFRNYSTTSWNFFLQPICAFYRKMLSMALLWPLIPPKDVQMCAKTLNIVWPQTKKKRVETSIKSFNFIRCKFSACHTIKIDKIRLKNNSLNWCTKSRLEILYILRRKKHSICSHSCHMNTQKKKSGSNFSKLFLIVLPISQCQNRGYFLLTLTPYH